MIQTTIYASNRDTHQAAVKPNRLDCHVYSHYDSVSGYDSDYLSSGYRGHLTSSSLYCKPMLYCCAYSDYDSGNGYDSNINKRHLVAVISQTKYKLFYTLWLCQWPWLIILPSDPFNTLRPRQNGRHFADDTFKRIFVNENVGISIEFSLKFVPKVPINNIPALVQIMAWRRQGDKPLSEPMMV